MTVSSLRSQGANPRWFWVLLIGIAGFGMGQAILHASSDLIIDEPFVANAIHGSWAEMFTHFQTDLALPLHFLVLKLWAGVFGESEFALRFPSILFYGGSILIVGLIARRNGERSGLIASLLMASSVTMGQEHAFSARMYALLGFEIALSTWGAFEIVERIRTGRMVPRWLYGIMGTLFLAGMLTHTIYFFFLCALMLMVLIWARRAFIPLLLIGVISGALYLIPMYPLLIKSQPLQWLSKATPENILWGFRLLWFSLVSEAVLLLALTLMMIRLARRRNLPSEVVQAGFMTVVMVLLTWGTSQITPIFIATRTPMLFLGLICVGVGVLFAQTLPRSAILLVGIFIAAASVGLNVLRLNIDHAQTRESVASLIDHAQCGDWLILTSLSYSEVVYYLRRLNAPPCLNMETFPPDTETHPGWIDRARYQNDPTLLQTAADDLVRRLSASDARKVWVFWDQARVDLNQALSDALEMGWQNIETVPFYGTYFTKILVYEAR